MIGVAAFLVAQTLMAGPAILPTQADVRSTTVTLDSSGNATWDFTAGGSAPAFAGTPDVTHFPKALDTTNPIMCNHTALTTVAVTMHCWRTNLTGLLSGLMGGTVAGAQVDLIARYKGN